MKNATQGKSQKRWFSTVIPAVLKTHLEAKNELPFFQIRSRHRQVFATSIPQNLRNVCRA